MLRIKLFLGCALFFSAIVVARAQLESNPIGQIFHSLGVIGNGLKALTSTKTEAAASAPSAAASPRGEPSGTGSLTAVDRSAMTILQRYAAQYPQIDVYSSSYLNNTSQQQWQQGACDLSVHAYADVQQQLNELGTDTLAHVSALRRDAITIAACASGPNTGSISPQKAYTDVGRILAQISLAQHATGLIDQATSLDAHDAMALLRANPGANGKLIGDLAKSGMVSDMVGTQNGIGAIHMTAKIAVAKYKSNAFGFNSRYAGKILAISGPIQIITGSGNQATLVITGFMPADPNNQGFEDQIECEIRDASQLRKASILNKGQTVTVRGLYNPTAASSGIGITLVNCGLD